MAKIHVSARQSFDFFEAPRQRALRRVGRQMEISWGCGNDTAAPKYTYNIFPAGELFRFEIRHAIQLLVVSFKDPPSNTVGQQGRDRSIAAFLHQI